MDVIKINIPTFLRLLELVREQVKNDPDLHDIAEIAVQLSKEDIISMSDYDSIVDYMQQQGNDAEKELKDIKRLGGLL